MITDRETLFDNFFIFDIMYRDEEKYKQRTILFILVNLYIMKYSTDSEFLGEKLR